MKKLYFSEEEVKAAKSRNAKRYRERHKDKVRQRDIAWKSANKDKLAAYRQHRRNTPEGYVDRFLERAKIRTPDTDLDRDFFKDKMEACAFTGHPFTFEWDGDSYHNPTAPSIDRINSKIGYYKNNVQVVLSCINRMKNDLPQEEFNTLWRALTNG